MAPPLGRDNAVAQLARTIKAEVESLERSAQAATLPVQAQLAYRRVVFDLLFHGLGAEPQALAVAGLRLADVRAAFDQLTQRQLPEEHGGAAARVALQEFVEECRNGLKNVPDAAAPERVLVVELATLRKAVSLLETRELPGAPDAWPTPAAMAAPAGGAPASAPAGAPPASAPPAGADHDAAAMAVANAGWLSQGDRDALATALRGGRFNPEGKAALAEALSTAPALMRGEGAWDTERLRAAFREVPLNPPGVVALARALNAVQRVRTVDLGKLPPAVRGPAREIQTQARRSAVKLAETLPQLVRSPSVAADPALDSAVGTQVNAAQDLRRLQEAGAWPDQLAGVRAGTRDAFAAVVKAWAAALLQGSQRPATRAKMDAFAQQLAAFAPVRLEARLRAKDEVAQEAAAGLSDRLLQCIDQRRDAWAAAWAKGDGGQAAVAMGRAARVMQALAAVAALPDQAAQDRSLARWGGFAWPPGGLGTHPKALRARAQVAAEALVTDRDAEVDTQLEALARDLPVTWLAAQCMERLQEWIAQRRGVLAQLDAACSGPAAGSWMGADRAALMSFARYAREESELRDHRDPDAAQAIRAYLASLAATLVQHMEGAPAARGSDTLRP